MTERDTTPQQQVSPAIVQYEIEQLAAAVYQAEDALHDRCVEAHDQGLLTWQQIGDSLGISRQAAWERFTQAKLKR